MKLEFAAVSNLGDRPVNEDFYGSQQREPDGWLFALADGLGGHGKGDEASRLAVSAAMELYGGADHGEKTGDLLSRLFDGGQEQLFRRQLEQHCPGSMKTTLNLALVQGERLLLGHVGDTRTYLFRDGAQLLRTRDHSVPQMLVLTGEIRENAIRHHPDRNRLLRVMGAEWDTPKYELEEEIALLPGDALLMCTDGFWEWITEREMLRALKKADSVQDWVALMDGRVQRNGRRAKMDNNTALAVWAMR